MASNFQAGSRAKLDDYDGEGKAVILRAIRDFEARVMGKNFFPSDTTRARWAEDSFQAACAHLQVDYLSDKRVLTLVSKIVMDYMTSSNMVTDLRPRQSCTW